MDLLGWLPDRAQGSSLPVHFQTDNIRRLAAGGMGATGAVVNDILMAKHPTAQNVLIGAGLAAAAEIGLQHRRRRRISDNRRAQDERDRAAHIAAERHRTAQRAHIVPTPRGRRSLVEAVD